jgi:ABC-type transporter Mla MlaB component
MLRITTLKEDSDTITMKLEGKLASDWVPLLESECKRCLKDKRKVLLDLSDVTFVDNKGVGLLSRMAKKHVWVVECPDLVGFLLSERRDGK